MRAVVMVVGVIVLCSLAARPAWAQSPGWTRMDLRPVSQPVVAGDRAVLYLAAGGGLRVVGLDLATGATVWSRDATTSDMAPGEEPGLAVMGGKVIFLAKESDFGASVTAVDAERGNELWSTSGDFNGTPAPCPGAPSAVCVTGLVGVIGAPDGIN
jgi:outer membrane protein assembly factor BamB